MRTQSSHVRARLSRGRAAVFGAVGATILGAAFSAPGGQAHAQQDAATTSYGWTLTPAGRQTALGDFPMNGAVSPDGRFLAVVNAGQGTETLQVVRVSDSTVVQTVAQPQDGAHPAYFYTGIAFNPAGDTLYVSTSAPYTPPGLPDAVRAYSVAESGSGGGATLMLTPDPAADITLPSGAYPAGIVVTSDALYVAENLAGGVAKVDLADPSNQSFLATGTSVPSCASQSPVAPAQLTCPYPTAMTLDASGKRVVVTNQGESSVSVLDFAARTVHDVTVGLHPNALLLDPSGRVFVSNGDGQSISIVSSTLDSVVGTIDVRPFANAKEGSDPDAMALSADAHTIYVAEAGENAVAVVHLTPHGGTVTGFIPTAWYPTTVLLSNDGRLRVLNAKGLGSGPNPGYQQGTYGPEGQYVANMMQGTLSTIDVPSPSQLAADTAQVGQDNRFGVPATLTGGGSVIPNHPGGPSPIKHVVFILKENRTFDQIFGDLKNGSDGDPSLAMFGQSVTPNLHALAHQFVTLDNFYADAEISAQGHNWATQAESNDYTEKNYLNDYADFGQRGYDFEGTNTAASGPAGYLWNAAQRSGTSFRNYGEFVSCNDVGLTPPIPCLESLAAGTLTKPAWVANDPSLVANTDPQSAGFTFLIPDVKTPNGPAAPPGLLTRYDAWHADFASMMASPSPDAAMPTFEFLRLPNDHTQGTAPGDLTPKADEAQNDYALGRVVDDISHSAVWKDTAIFVTEDDAQDGPDHVDGHRTEALVVSPYTQKAPGAPDRVDDTRYDTVSMLKTMELIAGMSPLSRYDAAATPMLASFTGKPVLLPYSSVLPDPAIDGTRNTAASPMAAQSAALNFSVEDAAPMDVLNHILWADTMGGRPYPATKGSGPPDAGG